MLMKNIVKEKNISVFIESDKKEDFLLNKKNFKKIINHIHKCFLIADIKKDQKISVKDFKFIKMIGKGAHGKVYLTEY